MPMGVKTVSTPNRAISSIRCARVKESLAAMEFGMGPASGGRKNEAKAGLGQRQGGGQYLVEIVLGRDIQLGRRLDLVGHHHVQLRHHGDELAEGAAGGI